MSPFARPTVCVERLQNELVTLPFLFYIYTFLHNYIFRWLSRWWFERRFPRCRRFHDYISFHFVRSLFHPVAACSSQRGGQANLTWLDPRPDVAPDLARYPRPVERALGLAQLCTSGWEAINHWWDRSVEWPWHRSVQRSTAMCSLPSR